MYLSTPPHDPLQAITRTANPVRRAFHLLLALLGWVAFLLFLYHAFLRPLDEATLPTFLVLGGVALTIALVDLLWIRFNLHLHRTRRPRTRVTEREYSAVEDLLSRPLEGAEWNRLRAATRIGIELTDGGRGKRYVILDPGIPGPHEAAPVVPDPAASPVARAPGPAVAEGERPWTG